MSTIGFSRRRLLLAGACAALCAAGPARADWQKIREGGVLKVAVYKEFAPFSDNGSGIDVDLAHALAAKLNLKLSLLPFPAGEALGDDLRNMVWKGHYLGYGPADVMLHVPVDPRLMQENPQVKILAPYHLETVRLARSAARMPSFDGIDSLVGRSIGVEKVSIAGMLMLGEGNGRFRDQVRIYDTAGQALQALKDGALDAVLATRSEIDSALRGDPAYPVAELPFRRLPRNGWPVGLAVRKSDDELARQVQAAVSELASSGELKTIFARYGVHLTTP